LFKLVFLEKKTLKLGFLDTIFAGLVLLFIFVVSIQFIGNQQMSDDNPVFGVCELDRYLKVWL